MPQFVILSSLVRHVPLRLPVRFSDFLQTYSYFIGDILPELFWDSVIKHPYWKPSLLTNTIILPLTKSPDLPLRNDSYSPVSSFFLHPNILVMDLLPQTLTILPFTRVRSYNLKPYTLRGMVLFLCFLKMRILK